jgi:NAD(P)-dependent dehydrogenase (short-subunit alcohol dehydrogenase family)
MTVRKLSECTALVTGSRSGIGFEIAAQLAEAGVPRLYINGRDEARGAQALQRLKARAPDCDVRFHAADLRTYEAARGLVDQVITDFASLDILVTSIPGHLSPRPFHTIEPGAFEEQIQSHLGSVLYTCHAAMPHLIARAGGVIVNLASDAAKVATPGEALQGALKAGVVMFSRTLALEASRYGIRVHAITPSVVKGTAAYERIMASEFSQKLFAKAESKAKLGVVEPADIAPLVVFLAGPGAAKMTGQAISVNGGISAS